MYVSLYRRYRPQNFSDVVGQSAAVSVLQQSLNENRIGHAYLFSGPRGCGKTSVARILAKALNCLSPKENSEPCCECANCTSIAAGEHLDVIEIDGASNRGINEIRDLKSRVNLKPLNAVYKIYIIDEVHMLTEQAFNALLKTLEEPPSNVVFMLATTEPNKVPVTIRSRCQHIPFHRISMSDLVKRISFICGKEGIEAEAEAVWEIARQADGALRDALSITEQAVALGGGALTVESLKGLLGGSSRTELEMLVTELRTEPETAAKRLHEIFSRGVSVETFAETLFNLYRDLWMFSLWGENSFNAVEASEAEHDYIRREAANWTSSQLKAACMFCNKLMPRAKYGMKTEIFSGLILLGLGGISENEEQIKENEEQIKENAERRTQNEEQVKENEERRTKNEEQVKENEERRTKNEEQVKENEEQRTKNEELVKENEKVRADNEETQITNSGEDRTENNVQQQTADNDIIPYPMPFAKPSENEAYDASALCEKLGGTFSKLAEAFPEDKLLLCAALLDAEIVKDGASWKLAFVRNGRNENILKNAEKQALLEKAVCGVFGFAPPQNREEAPVPEVSKQPVFVSDTADRTAEPISAVSENPRGADASIDRMLKLVGAEILYVEEDNVSDGSESDS
ncbi:MAG: DNA polymerase III subunit gamma/tau [Synergistaceae bacterium]|nr:DNA polymerase III subunit gamma/tau [Candidatus Equadaptatus faecalis]